MDLNEIKSDWKAINGPKKSQKELASILEFKSHPEVKGLRLKFIVEIVLLVSYLVIYNDFFDGPTKPWWVNIVLISSALFFISSDVFGWITLRSPIQKGSILNSLARFNSRLHTMKWLSITSSLLFGCSFIAFSSASVAFTQTKYLILAGMIVVLFALVYLSSRSWLKRTHRIRAVIAEFDQSQN